MECRGEGGRKDEKKIVNVRAEKWNKGDKGRGVIVQVE